MYFSTKIDHRRIRHCDINRVKYNHKDLITVYTDQTEHTARRFSA